jgi:hypothetical protein
MVKHQLSQLGSVNEHDGRLEIGCVPAGLRGERRRRGEDTLASPLALERSREPLDGGTPYCAGPAFGLPLAPRERLTVEYVLMGASTTRWRTSTDSPSGWALCAIATT